jgi:CheY-like chemotaxis protein
VSAGRRPAPRPPAPSRPARHGPSSRGTVRLIVWNAAEAEDRAAFLAAAGWVVDRSLPPGPALFRELRAHPPDAILIDLGRLPSQGRDVALTIRTAAALRRVPLLFVEGDAEKTAKVRALLPDAAFTTWNGARGALQAAVTAAVRDAASGGEAPPLSSPGVFAGYSGTPLPKKLGIKPGMTVALVKPPPRFAGVVGELPEGAVLKTGTRSRPGLVLWFVRTGRELAGDLGAMAAFAGEVQLWIAWRKKAALTAGSPADAPSERSVRAAGLAAGLVDFKVCAIDASWSGLLFTRRRPARGPGPGTGPGTGR